MNIIDFLSAFIKLFTQGYRGAGIVYLCGNHVLMQLRMHPKRWAFIGGSYDKTKDADYRETAVREFWEETGVKLRISDLEKEPVHALGFWHYRWELYLVISDKKIEVDNAPEEYRHEYQKYRYINLYDVRKDLSSERYHKLFFFVSYQLKKVRRYIEIKR